ncbi:hypothetical protein CSTERTH_01380 [Thermoclostridium stercorarium subsp. thermolacticum DSM 2910]|uniref:SLH domain-containing protein n=1 Tax=Thermoclostridium stercorarium subsp. thermolacticum DSM 2910 TaxID=1121336 RepID=A0A1B1YAI0_THEST|nr:S-layer homology domain-containing protein [Thermoclostridium stercorarium]ANW97777.1 hypothetical protein CSTERTH_01380 [Thermoclostridium stercorarium subsp. thermolacticum DSM 2910]
MPKGEVNGYIRAAVEMGYITAMPDGLFHPNDSVTYAQIATTLVKLLGYSDEDLTGYWPYNCLSLLENLNVLDGITYKPQDGVTVKELAVIVDRLFKTRMKNGSEYFIDTTPNFKEVIVLKTATVDSSMDQKRIETDNGVFYLDDGIFMPELGYRYTVRTEDNIITAMAGQTLSYEKYSVKEVSADAVVLNNQKKVRLNGNISYYYNGKTIEASEVLGVLKTNSSVIIASRNGSEIYGVVFDPVYSAPKIITASMTGDALERLYFGKFIDRNGKKINPSQLEVNDVVYEITDIWGNNGYVVVYDNEVSGEITNISPNLMAPESIELGGVSYQLDSSFPVEKINKSGTIEVGQTVTLLLGKDNKVVDAVLSGTGENDNYVLVLNAYTEKSQEIENYGEKLYFVTLLHTDGSIKTYLAKKDMSALKGDLATYSIIETGEDYDTVSLTAVEYLPRKTHEIFKDERKIDNLYVADNVVIFNMINNVYGRNSDAEILKWSDLPSGKIEASKLKYIHTTGDFMDIDVLYFDNILDEGIYYGLVTDYRTEYKKSGEIKTVTQTITMLVKGEEYTYETGEPISGIIKGAVLKLRMSGNTILSVEDIKEPYVTSDEVQASDTSRIRINDTTYKYHRDFAVYQLRTDGTYKRVGTDKITDENTKSVSLYLDKPLSYGGKVVMVIIK